MMSEGSKDANEKSRKKGEGTMSALVQRCSYDLGKKKSDKREQVISKEELKSIKESLEKYLPKKK